MNFGSEGLQGGEGGVIFEDPVEAPLIQHMDKAWNVTSIMHQVFVQTEVDLE